MDKNLHEWFNCCSMVIGAVSKTNVYPHDCNKAVF